MRSRYVITIIFLFFAFFTEAQNSPYRFKTLSVNDGLSQNSIWQILRDRNGFLWVGTADGLNRYDGYEVTAYKRDLKDTNSLSGNNITILIEDKYGHIWIGSDRGLDVYDPVKNNFIHKFTFPFIAAIKDHCYYLFDEPDGEHLWIKPVGHDLLRYNTKQCTLSNTKTFINNIAKQKPEEFRKAYRVNETAIVLFDGGDLLKCDFNTKTMSFLPININGSGDFKMHGDHLYFLKDNAFSRYDIKTGRYEKMAFVPKMESLNKMSLVKNNWVITSGVGYAFIDTLTYKVTFYESFDHDKKESYNRTASFLYDKEGIMWFGTDGRGLRYTSTQAVKFKTYQSIYDEENMIKGICTLPGNKLVTAVYDEGIVVHDLNTYTNVKLDRSKAFPVKPMQNFTSVCAANDSEIWVTNNQEYRYGLFLVNIYTGKSKEYTHLIANPAFPQKVVISSYQMAYRKNDRVFISRNDIVFEMIYSKGRYTTKVLTGESGANISSIYYSNDGKFLITGYVNGTYVRKLNDKVFKLRLKQDGEQLAKCINEDLEGNYYVATTNGVYVYNKSFERVDHFSTSNYLPDNFVYGILCDDDGNMWFSHNKGLSCYFVKGKSFKHYTVKDGLQSNEFNTGAYYKAADGQLFFGGVDGVNAFFPKDLLPNSNKTNVFIGKINLLDEPYISDTAYWLKQYISLPYFQNTISFEFMATEMTNAANNQYAYMMEGVDEKWIYNNTKRFARYANLPHGEYKLKVKASNSDGIWNDTPTVLAISIKPPFWKTLWFYSLLGVLILSIVLGLVYIWINRQKIRLQRELDIQQKLENERLRISRDLHDNVGAQLSYLITNIEWMLEHPHQISEADEQIRLKALSEAGRNAILTLRQTIWAISNTTLSVEDFADRFKQFALKMLEFNKEIQVHFHDDFVTSRTLSPAIALNMFRICQEAFNNCLKHASCSEIDIRFNSDEIHSFVFMITDNGKGFDWEEAQRKGHYGLINMQARATETHAMLDISSEKGKGTTLILHLK